VSVALVLAIALSTTTPAWADPLSAKRAQAAAVQSQVTALDTKASIADEAYNAARDRYSTLAVQVAASEHRISQLEDRSNALQADLAARANQIYRDGGVLAGTAALLTSQSFAQFDATLGALEAIATQDAETVAQLKQTQADAQAERLTLLDRQGQAAIQQAEMAANAQAVHLQLAERTRLLDGLSADIKTLLAQERARQAAAAHARYLALIARQHATAAGGGHPSGSPGGFSGGSPPASARGAAAVTWAEKALGRPYQWAASGPDRFDCSGLVMWAYRHVGVNLPHSSRAQIDRGSRVSRDALRPGDLVFFGSPIHHVGMYVGGGDFIEAPGTGGRVQISALGHRGDYAGACRP
jgi:cell wall-associated NlpC family hydrolase